MTSTTGQTPTNRQAQGADRHLNGAAIIDADGREIPITEHMICAALQALEAGEAATQSSDQPQRRPS